MFKYLKKKNLDKNIIMLGDDGCGKRECVYSYKNGSVLSDCDKAEDTIILKKNVDTNLSCNFNFVLQEKIDNSFYKLFSKKKPFDLVLVLVDLSSTKALDSLSRYKKMAKTQHPDVPVLCVGTQSDKKLQDIGDSELIEVSKKTGEGFDQLEAKVNDLLGLGKQKVTLEFK